jgi:hypothetical protein
MQQNINLSGIDSGQYWCKKVLMYTHDSVIGGLRLSLDFAQQKGSSSQEPLISHPTALPGGRSKPAEADQNHEHGPAAPPPAVVPEGAQGSAGGAEPCVGLHPSIKSIRQVCGSEGMPGPQQPANSRAGCQAAPNQPAHRLCFFTETEGHQTGTQLMPQGQPGEVKWRPGNGAGRTSSSCH